MNFSFHPVAEDELNAAIECYETVSSGLGYDFALEVYATIQRVVDFPKPGYSWMGKSEGV